MTTSIRSRRLSPLSLQNTLPLDNQVALLGYQKKDPFPNSGSESGTSPRHSGSTNSLALTTFSLEMHSAQPTASNLWVSEQEIFVERVSDSEGMFDANEPPTIGIEEGQLVTLSIWDDNNWWTNQVVATRCIAEEEDVEIWLMRRGMEGTLDHVLDLFSWCADWCASLAAVVDPTNMATGSFIDILYLWGM
ncbi:hypothetical protein DENSPDRAFT_854895 [Dentipellis sp. KUC8613]|nr:hypothetical protein DENSPDRAFT_854895 [Dentipellis sp. KUC8613]